MVYWCCFFFSSRRRHTRYWRDWSSDVCSSDLEVGGVLVRGEKGTAKSTAVRALARLLPPIRVISGCPYSCDPEAPNPECPAGPHPEDAPWEWRPVRLAELPVGASTDRPTGTPEIEEAATDRKNTRLNS